MYKTKYATHKKVPGNTTGNACVLKTVIAVPSKQLKLTNNLELTNH